MDDSRMSFLGRAGLAKVRASTACVVGCGGGGSHVAEQLTRLSVGTIYLIDPDRLERSNLNRVVGSTDLDVGENKAEIIARRLSWTSSRIVSIPESVRSAVAIAAVQSSDWVFGCVDRFRVRDDIERICRQAFATLIDIGLGIQVEHGTVVSAGGQVVLSIPGEACMRCMDVITETTLARDREEYVSTGSPEQQVVSMNGLLASEAIELFLSLTTGFSRKVRLPRYVVFNAMRHELTPHPFFAFGDLECSHYPIEQAGERFEVTL